MPDGIERICFPYFWVIKRAAAIPERQVDSPTSLLGQRVSYTECIHADIKFQGATRDSCIYVIDNKNRSEILMLGTDVTAPGNSPESHWTKSKAKDAKANGMFSASDMNRKKVFVTHTFLDRDLAKRIAISLKL